MIDTHKEWEVRRQHILTILAAKIQAFEGVPSEVIKTAAEEIDAAVLELVVGEDEKHERVRKPTHGACCTCQTCGLPYDDCDEDGIEVRNEHRASERQIITGKQQ
jgi:hypothetical protein